MKEQLPRIHATRTQKIANSSMCASMASNRDEMAAKWAKPLTTFPNDAIGHEKFQNGEYMMAIIHELQMG